MSIEQKKIDFLKSTQTDTKSHSGTTLIEHLKGVHDILKKGGAPQYLQDAGLFHSILELPYLNTKVQTIVI